MVYKENSVPGYGLKGISNSLPANGKPNIRKYFTIKENKFQVFLPVQKQIISRTACGEGQNNNVRFHAKPHNPIEILHYIIGDLVIKCVSQGARRDIK